MEGPWSVLSRPTVERNLSVVQLEIIDRSPENPFLQYLLLLGVGEEEDSLNTTEDKKNLISECFLLNLYLSLNWFYL